MGKAAHVGSLLRPAALKEAREKHAKGEIDAAALKAARAKRERGEITAEELKAIEDREIAQVIRKQEETGLKSVTDGEFRRAFWNYDFLGEIDGVEAYLGEARSSSRDRSPSP